MAAASLQSFTMHASFLQAMSRKLSHGVNIARDDIGSMHPVMVLVQAWLEIVCAHWCPAFCPPQQHCLLLQGGPRQRTPRIEYRRIGRNRAECPRGPSRQLQGSSQDRHHPWRLRRYVLQRLRTIRGRVLRQCYVCGSLSARRCTHQNISCR